MKNKLFILIFCVGIFYSCDDKEPPQDKIGECPAINDPISWINGTVKYGDWQFGYTWIDGNFGVGTGDAEVIDIHNDCECPFNETETCGTGNTYAVYLSLG
jgi:hypothetical protein